MMLKNLQISSWRAQVWLVGLAVALFALSAGAQPLAPSGYTGVINTPTALTMKSGSMGLALTNSIPEFHALYPGVGGFGGLNLGFGLVEGLEAVGRLTFNGDLNCDTYLAGCQSSTRDLSVGGKYQLPLEKIFGATIANNGYLRPDLAVGITDYGGAATLYRQKYVVGSLTSGPVVLSAGTASSIDSSHGGGLINGKFGSAILKLTDHFSLLAETDTRERRAGISWSHRITGNADLHLAASKKFTHHTDQQASQATVGQTYYFGRGDKESAAQPLDTRPWPTVPLAASQPQPPPPEPRPEPEPTSDHDKARALAEVFSQNGFSDVDVGKTPSGWIVRAEPRVWRQNRLDAFGAAMASFMLAARKVNISDASQLSIAVTFMGQSVGGMSVGGPFSALDCIKDYLKGNDLCMGARALSFHYEQERLPDFAQVQWLIRGEHSKRFMPQFEISPAASYTAGTEFGLFDYSIGTTLGWEVPLARGLFWQGFRARLITESDDFKDKNSYFRRVGMGEASRPGANLLGYQQRLLPSVFPRLWGQLMKGDLGYKTSGQQFNGYWASEDGKYRMTWVRGEWHNPEMVQVRRPNILNLGVRPFDSNFQVTYATGRFHNNDTGHRISTSFSFDDYGLQFFWRKTGPSDILPNRNAYMGFSLTLPLGPKQALTLGPTTWRLRDRWEVGVETKVGQKDNYIEPFYGAYPGIRHSLDTDVFDFNRNDVPLMEANAYRLRVTAREVYQAAQK
ncbi:MAG: YjbH domain-containing protein [Limnohabitans sp.]|nr:YjbH domain-containing protein [Limnohabitans sp.]